MSGAKLRVAGVGAGYFSQFHVDAWTRQEGVEYVALCDSDAGKARGLAERFNVPEIFTDVETMLDRVGPDVFDIVTPPQTHEPLVELACRRKITTICQKPLAPTYDEAKSIVALARNAGVELIAHENFRFSPWFREARRLLVSGMLGTPHAIAFKLRPGDGQGPDAYLNRQPYFQRMPRFLIHETGIHFIDVFRYIMGEITGVFARLRRMNRAIAGEDAGYVIFEFENGTTGLLDGNRLNDHIAEDTRFTMGDMWLEGSAGVLRLDGAGRLWFKPHRGEEREHPYPLPMDGFAGDCVRGMQAHVVAHLQDGAPLETAAAGYLRNLEIEEAIYTSHAEGRWLTVPITA